MQTSTRNRSGRDEIDTSDINSNSICSKLNIQFDIACTRCKFKLDPLINRQLNQKQKTERQRSR